MNKYYQLGIAIAVLFIAAIPSHAVIIGFNQLDPFDSIGDSVKVEIVVSGLGDPASSSVGSFDINVAYDSSVLDFISYELGPFLGDLSSDPSEAMDSSFGEVSEGIVNIAELSFLVEAGVLNSLQPSTFSLATLTFAVNAVRSSTLELASPSTLSDEKGVSIKFEQKAGTVAPVPEPAALVLLATGLAGLAGFGRKKFRAR